MFAVDHGYFQGPTTGLKNLKKAIDPLMSYADCLYITRGMVRNVVDAKTTIPIFLRVSGGPSILQEDLSDEHITVSMKEALRCNAVGVGMSMFVGGKFESRTVANLGKLVNEAEKQWEAGEIVDAEKTLLEVVEACKNYRPICIHIIIRPMDPNTSLIIILLAALAIKEGCTRSEILLSSSFCPIASNFRMYPISPP